MKPTAIKKIAINLIVFLVLMEGVSYWSIPKFQKLCDQFAESKIIGRVKFWTLENVKRPHPYFGYLPPQSDSYERWGHLSLEPNEDVFRIGVFGGSVGEQLANYWDQKRVLHQLLKQHPFFKNRRIEVFKFALGGYRQPQQFNIASIYGRSMDMVINIEGYNELTYHSEKKFPLYYPLQVLSHSYFSEPGSASATDELFRRYNRTVWRDQWIDRTWLWKLPKLLLLVRQYQDGQNISSIYKKLENLGRPFDYPDSYSYMELNRRFWLKMSCLQQTVLDQYGVPSLYFSQPVPFVKGLKQLTAEEKDRVEPGNPHFYFAKGYDLALKENQKAETKASQFDMIDATEIFKKHSGTVYIDDCCHLNDEGHKVFSEFIAKRILDTIATRQGLSRRCNLSRLLKKQHQ